MAKEFDIYLNNRLTECDIIVYSIPYREGITAMNKMVLESCIKAYTLQKFVAAQTGSDLVAHIDEMLKICYERLNYGAEISMSANFIERHVTYPDASKIDIGVKDIKMLANSFASANNEMIIAASPLLVSVARPFGECKSSLTVSNDLRSMLKRSIESANSKLITGATVVATDSQKIVRVDAPVCVSQSVADLCYQLTNAANTLFEIAAVVIGTEVKTPLGHAYSGVSVNATMTGMTSTKFEIVKSVTDIMCGVEEHLRKYLTIEESSFGITATASAVTRHRRILSEMDNDQLSKYDNASLDDVDYMMLS